jgi:hypothetical protein
MVSHYDIKYWSCGLCGKNFKWIKNVKYHLKAVHGQSEASEIRKNCVKLRKAPTKAEIDSMAKNQQQQQAETTILQLETSAVRPPEYVDLSDFKATLTATFVLPE